jgi:diaminopimelate decarboxylase
LDSSLDEVQHREVAAREDLLEQLVAAYGTPTYVYDLRIAREYAQALQRMLPSGVKIHYSVKANPHPIMISTLSQLGLRVEISSEGELDAALAAAVRRDHILYTGPAKTARELGRAIDSGVRLFSVESQVDLSRLTSIAAGTDVAYLIRLASGGCGSVGLRMTGASSQFGVDPAALLPGSGFLNGGDSTHAVGFHVFSATNAKDEAALITEFAENINTISATIERTGFNAQLVDIGGGFGAPYAAPGSPPGYPHLRDTLTRYLDEGLPGWRSAEPMVMVESGRYLAAAAGTLLTTVMDIKDSGGRKYLLCDAGVNVLGGIHGFGRLVNPKAQPENQSPDSSPVVLAGPLCTPMDVISRSARIDRPVVGGVLAIPNVGAYGLSASLVNFLSRPIAAEIVVEGTEVIGARRLGVVESHLFPEPRDECV